MSAAHIMAEKIETALLIRRELDDLNIFEFQTNENIGEVAVAPGNEDKEKKELREGVQEDAENGSKGIEKIDDEENHVIDSNTFLL